MGPAVREESNASWRKPACLMEYFAQPVRWQDRLIYLLYYSNDQDGAVLEADGRLLTAADPDTIAAAAKKRKVKLQAIPDEIDLATIQQWAGSRSSRLPSADSLYRAWNFLGDIATSLEKADSYLGYDEDFTDLHEELFWGCNMPGFSQSAERYEIDLSQTEIRHLRSIMKSGLEIFSQGLTSPAAF